MSQLCHVLCSTPRYYDYSSTGYCIEEMGQHLGEMAFVGGVK